MSDLRTQTRDRLPASVLELWDELEAYADLEIQVAQYSADLAAGEDSLPAAIMAGSEGATIFLPMQEPLTDQAAYHELLHARRLWIEKVPELANASPSQENWRLVGEIEGDIEHLVIVPRQYAVGLGERERLLKGASQTWANYPWPDMINAWRRRYTCLMHWASHHLMADEALLERMERCIKQERLFTEAELFRNKLLSQLDDKPTALATAVRFLKIPPDDVSLRYVDIKSRTSRLAPLTMPR